MEKQMIKSMGKGFLFGSVRSWSFWVVGFTVFLLLFAVTASAEPLDLQPGKKRFLVKYRAGFSQSEIAKGLKNRKVKMVKSLRGIDAKIVEFDASADVATELEKLRKNPHVKFVEEDRLVAAEEVIANDPYSVYAWHLSKVEVPSAWELAKGENIIVAVLDTGVDEDHPDLEGQTVPGWNIYDDNTDTADVFGHGTKVAGVIAATSDNGIGVTSIAWNSQIMPVRISRPDGYASISDISDGIIWAADHGARIANISYDVATSPTVQSAAAYMREKGGLVTVSAGNSGVYRSDLSNDTVIAVGATSSTDLLAGFSNYGEFVDLVAPGVTIMTTSNGGSYTAASGTSFSSPVVAAVAALMMAANPLLDSAQIHQLLKSSADDLGDVGEDIYFGAGRVNAGRAVATAWAETGVDNTAPLVQILSPAAGEVAGMVLVDVGATDDVAVERVDLYVDGTLVGSETTSPYSFSWDSRLMSDGQKLLVAYAVDAAGNRGISSVVAVEVKNTDTEPPVVAILSPTAGTITGTVAVSVSAIDNVGVEKVELYLDGSLLASSAVAPYAFSLDSSQVANGPVSLVAQAIDAAGNRAISGQVVLDVQNVLLEIVPGDLDNDRDVDYADYQAFVGSYNRSTGDTGFLVAADYDADGYVGYADFQTWYGYYRAYVYGN